MQSASPKIESGSSYAGPAFLIGQDRAGRWLAVETHGLGGGVFTSRDAALTYARAETDRRDGAILLSADPIALT